MNDECYRKEWFVLRFTDISFDDVSAIRALFPGKAIKEKVWKNSANFVVVVPIECENDPTTVARLVRERGIPESKFGVWAHLVTEADSGGVAVPDYVMKWSRLVGGQVDFSFTCV